MPVKKNSSKLSIQMTHVMDMLTNIIIV